MDVNPVFLIGLLLVVVGVILIIISSIKITSTNKGKQESSGFILIGPIPILWGSSRKAVAIMGVIAALIILFIALSWFASLTGG